MGSTRTFGIAIALLAILIMILVLQRDGNQAAALTGSASLNNEDHAAAAQSSVIGGGSRAEVPNGGRERADDADLGLRVSVTVRDRSTRRPLAEARVFVAKLDGEFLAEAMTSGEGQADMRVSILETHALQIGVSLAGFVSAKRIVQTATGTKPVSLNYELQPGGRLVGRVVGGLSGLPIRGATVMLIPMHQRFSKQVLLLASEGVSECLITHADEHGQFEVDGVSRGCSYRVYAGGKGQVSKSPTLIFLPDDRTSDVGEALQLEVFPAFGVSLHLEGLDGKPLRLPTTSGISLVMAAPREWDRSLDGVPFWTLGLAADDLLAGVEDVSGDVVQWAYASGREFTQVAGVSLTWDHPGCSYSTSVDVPRVEDYIPIQRIAFDCIGRDSASVRLVFSGSGLLSELSYDSPVYYLSMLEVGNPMASPLRFQMLPDGGGYQADGVPPGRYDFSIRPLSNWWRFPRIAGGLLVIEGGQDCDVVVQESEVSAIDLHIVEDGLSYEGSVRVAIRLVALDDAGPDATPQRFGSVKVDFAHAPYIIPLLGPGEYELSLFGGELGRDVSSASIVRVERGIAVVTMDRSSERD